MFLATVKDIYEARVKIGNHLISKIRGIKADPLKVYLSVQCDLESSGAKGELIDLLTGKIIYACRKQTIVDK
ncbi:hypothetical protein Lpar_0500 [Legionella parisiensis]|uniref:Uncharacterized protein n=1 Tax=Legionella parisiensis TaxID=45071 RepID=A0A1E5JPU1_9GAMM|nr:hypothetical protein Lpar_0500 [Legionella parisiensis]OEH46531.1 hypothetical protein lpari_02472 [Legionella parisiensis]STX72042.1 Uncharacterised protein [Legionella parisiensis]